MRPFLIGMAIAVIASIPTLLLARYKARRGMKNFVKLSALGVALRFTLIGLGLYWQLQQPETGKIPLILGIVFAFYLSLALEYLISRSPK